MPDIKLPDGKIIKFEKHINGFRLAEKISKSLTKDACIMSVNGELRDLSYEIKKDGETKKFVLHENGKYEAWIDGEKKDDGTWKFEAKEVYVNILEDGKEITYILKIESNGELTMIARIKDNKREEAPKQHQRTFKKLKE